MNFFSGKSLKRKMRIILVLLSLGAMFLMSACGGKTSLSSDDLSGSDPSSEQASDGPSGDKSDLDGSSDDSSLLISDKSDSQDSQGEDSDSSSEDDKTSDSGPASDGSPTSSSSGGGPTKSPTKAPTKAPTPTLAPSKAPTQAPTGSPSGDLLLPGSHSAFFTDLQASDKTAAKNFMSNALYKDGTNFGNSRIAAAMKKAASGQQVVIVGIGGSITQGMFAENWPNTGDNTYGGLVQKWFKDNFPGSNIQYRNTGLAATGSVFGVHRLQEMLLVHNPDLVLVDFSVNDKAPFLPQAKEAYESMIRRILNAPNKPGIIHIAFTDQAWWNEQVMHGEVLAKYGIPLLSLRDAIKHEIQDRKTAKFRDFHTDTIHPNAEGHYLAADIINYYLKGIKDTIDSHGTVSTALPSPVTANGYMNARILNNKTLTPIEAHNFPADNNVHSLPVIKYGWKSGGPGSKISFKVNTKALYLAYIVDNATVKFTVKIDNEPVQNLTATPGGNSETLKGWFLMDGGSVKERTLTIEITEGSDFKILGVFASD